MELNPDCTSQSSVSTNCSPKIGANSVSSSVHAGETLFSAAHSDNDDEIGIPNVPYMIWVAEKERDERLLRQGICPRHNVQMTVEDDREECPYCERGE